jgi:TonB family protein
MTSIARAALIAIIFPSAAAFAQTGPVDPQIIAAASTAKINAGSRKLAGQLVATVRVGVDGRVNDVQVTENTTDSGFEQQLVKVLESARFRPAIDDSGTPVEATIAMKVELRPSTGANPKPVSAKPDPQLTDKEKARIRKMRCSDFMWEWQLLRDEADDSAATEFMPRIAVSMYTALRNEAGEYVDAKVWKASAKALRDVAERCKDNPSAPFFDGAFRAVLDEAVPK